MKYFSVGLDYKRAPLELRSKALFPSEAKLEEFSAESVERVWLSTCNRVELYGISHENPLQILERWGRLCHLTEEELSCFLVYSGREAIQHLFRVTSSLESMVMGETQILGQVKRAYEEAHSKKWVGPHFHKAFQRAFKVAKRIRSQTAIGQMAVSIPSIGVKMAEKILGDLSLRRVGVIGLGEIGRVALEHFASIRPREVLLYNRTKEVAEDLARKFSGDGFSVKVTSSTRPILESCEVIVSAASAKVISQEEVAELDSLNRSTFLLDLSAPSSVDISNQDLQNVYFHSIDHLKKIAEENSTLRSLELDRAKCIIEEEVAGLISQWESHDVNQTFQKLSTKVDQMTAEELNWLRAQLPHISEEDWAKIEKMAFRLGSQIVKEPKVELKSLMEGSKEMEGESMVQLFRSLFRI